MSEPLADEVETVHTDVTANGSAGTIMEALRARHSQLLDSQHIFWAIPGYDDEMVAKYNVVDARTLMKIGDSLRKEKDLPPDEQQLLGAMDFLIKSCQEIYYDNGEKKIPLSEVMGVEGEVGFDSRLAEFLGFSDIETARGTIMAVFGGNEIALFRHAMLVQNWMTDTTKGASETLAGEL